MPAYKLYDTVNDKWLEFNTEEEMNSVYNSKEQNPMVKQKNGLPDFKYKKVPQRKSEDVLESALNPTTRMYGQNGNSYYSFLNTTGKSKNDYKEASKFLRKEIEGTEKFLKNDGLVIPDSGTLKLFPEGSIFFGENEYTYKRKDEYPWEARTNIVGEIDRDPMSKKGREYWGKAKNEYEDKNSWIADYYNLMSNGYENGFSDDSKKKYDAAYANLNALGKDKIKGFNPYDTSLVRSRTLSTIAGDNALKRYLTENNVSQESGIWQLANMSNWELAQLASENSQVNDLYNNLVDHYMTRYYGGIYEEYSNDPRTLSEYIHSNNSKYSDYQEKIEDTNSFVGKLIGHFGNEFANGAARTLLYDKKINNEQRNRADNTLDLISGRYSDNEQKKLDSLLQEGREEEYNKIVKNIINGDGNNTGFDQLAQSLYPYYDIRLKNNKSLMADDGPMSDKGKVKLMNEFIYEANTIGQEVATQRLHDKLQNMDYENEHFWTKIPKTEIKVANTFVGTAASMANVLGYAGVQLADLVGDLATADFSSIPDDLKYDFEQMMNSPLAQWGENVQNTGYWDPEKQKEAAKKGMVDPSIYIPKEAGKEESFDLYDAFPVMGMMLATKGGSALIQGSGKIAGMFSKGLSDVAKGTRSANLALSNTQKVGLAFEEGLGKALNAIDVTATATAPALSTFALDAGYGISGYQQDMQAINTFVGNDYGSCSEDFKNLVLSREAVRNFVEDNIDVIDVNKFGGKEAAVDFYYSAIQHGDPLIKNIYENEKRHYVQAATDNAIVKSAFTIGLTCIPDMKLAYTWNKVLYSPQTGVAKKLIQNNIKRAFRITPKVEEPKIKVTLSKNAEGKLVGEAKASKYTRADYYRDYINLMKGSFVSNYQQDIGVGIGNGIYNERMKEYLDQRFGDDAPKEIAYNIGDIIDSAIQGGASATFASTSFRDGAYGALAGFFTPNFKANFTRAYGIARETSHSFGEFTSTFSKELASSFSIDNPIYNWNKAKKGVDLENETRKQAEQATQEWLDNGGAEYLGVRGAALSIMHETQVAKGEKDRDKLISLDRQEKANNLLMFTLFSNTPGAKNALEFIKSRAERTITDEDIKKAAEYVSAIAQGEQIDLSSIKDKKVKGIVDDLINGYHYNLNTAGSGTVVDPYTTAKTILTDIRDNAKEFMEMRDNMAKYMSEASITLGENVSDAIKQEYAKMRTIRDYALKDAKKLKEKLNTARENSTITADMMFNENGSEATHDNLLIALHKGDPVKLALALSEHEKAFFEAKEAVKGAEELIKKSREAARQKGIDTAKDPNCMAAELIYHGAVAQMVAEKAKYEDIKKTRDKINKSDETANKKVIIAANEIANLSEAEQNELLNSDERNLSKTQVEENEKFLAAVDEGLSGETYRDILNDYMNAQAEANSYTLKGKLSNAEINELNNMVAERQKKRAENYYKELYSEFAMKMSGVENYESFVKAVSEKFNEINTEESNKTGDDLENERKYKKNALKEALKDNENFKKYQAKLNEYNTAVHDVKVSAATFYAKLNTAQRNELSAILYFAITMKGLSKDNVLTEVLGKEDAFFSELREFLEEKNKVVGTVEDLKDRIAQYNNDILANVAEAKAAEEKRTADKENENVEDTKQKIDQGKLAGIIDIINSYLTAENEKEAFAKLCEDLNFIVPLNSNSIAITKKIFGEALSKEYETTDDFTNAFEGIIDEISKNYREGDTDLEFAVAFVRTYVGNIKDNIGSTKPYKVTNPINVAAGDDRNGVPQGSVTMVPAEETPAPEPTISLVNNLNGGKPLKPAEVWKHPESNLYKLLENTWHATENLVKEYIDGNTKVYFLVSKQWSEGTAANMGDTYFSSRDMPVLAVIESKNGPITADNGKTYQPVCWMRSSERTGESNTAKLREHADDSNDTPTIIKENGEAMSTTFFAYRVKSDIDLDSKEGREIFKKKIEVPSANHVEFVDDGNKKYLKVNTTPNSNDVKKPGMKPAVVAELEEAKNADGKTLEECTEVEAETFNSRTEGFCHIINNIIELWDKAYSENLMLAVLNRLNERGPMTVEVSGLKALDCSIQQHLSLSKDYKWSMRVNNHQIALFITRDGVNAIKNSEGKPASFLIAEKDDEGNIVQRNEGALGSILKSLITYKNDDGKTLVKWNVKYEMCDLSLKEGNKAVSSTKQKYVSTVFKDGLLTLVPTKKTAEFSITPVMDAADRAKQEKDNAKVEEEAKAKVNAALAEKEKEDIDPTTMERNKKVGFLIQDAIKELEKQGKKKLADFLSRISEIRNGFMNDLGDDSKPFFADDPKVVDLEGHSNASISRIATEQDVKSDSSPDAIVGACIGNAADTAARNFFNPNVDRVEYKQKFREAYKDLLTEKDVDRLFNALEDMEAGLIQHGLHVCTQPIFVLQGNKRVGAIDILAYDNDGQIHIIDLKTIKSTSASGTAEDVVSDGTLTKWSNQLSLYLADMNENVKRELGAGYEINKKNIHIYCLPTEASADLFDVVKGEDKEGHKIATVTKKKRKTSTSIIKSGASYEIFDSGSSKKVQYVGDEKVKELQGKTKQNIDALNEQNEAENKKAVNSPETVFEDTTLPVDDILDGISLEFTDQDLIHETERGC